VVEIGPGRGALTRELLARCGRLIAVEIDRALCHELRATFGRRVQVVEGDFLEYPLPGVPYKVFGSVPFSRSTAIVRRIDAAPRPPEDAFLVLQREAAGRLAGSPYAPETRLSLLLKPRWQVEIAGRLRRSDFDPPPSVDCVLLWLARRPRPLVEPRQVRAYREFVTRCFGRRGPGVGVDLRALLTPTQLARASRDLRFDPRSPASQLGFDQWLGLFRLVARWSP